MPRTTYLLAQLVVLGCGGGRPPADEIVFVSHATASFREVEPTLAVSPDGRLLAVAWMGQSTADLATNLFPAYGHIDFLDLTFSGTSLFVAYGDNSSGASHITIRRLESP